MLKVNIDNDQLRREGIRISRKLDDPRPFFKQFRAYMLGRTGQTFRRLGRGGRFRGVRWRGYADQYTRKTDGVTVPAHGGVPKLRGRGLVKGRLRASGQRVTPSSRLLRDTGRLAAAAGTTLRFRDGGRTMQMITRNVAYGPAQQARRPFLFFELPHDAKVAARMALQHLRSE